MSTKKKGISDQNKKKYSDKTKRHATQLQGVYERRAVREKVGPDICYDISYKVSGQKIWEKVGWKSEGYSPELARDVRSERIRTTRHGGELPKQKAKEPTFKTVMGKYLSWADTNKANGRTTDNYLYQGQKGETGHLKHLDDKRLDEIHPFELEKLKKAILDKGLAPP